MSMPHVLARLAVGDPVTVAWHHDHDVVAYLSTAIKWAAWVRGVEEGYRVRPGPIPEAVARFADLGLDAPELLARDGHVKRVTKNDTVILDCGLRFETGTPRGTPVYSHRGPGSHDTRFVLAKRVEPLSVAVRVRVDHQMGHVVADFVESRGDLSAAACIRETLASIAERGE